MIPAVFFMDEAVSGRAICHVNNFLGSVHSPIRLCSILFEDDVGVGASKFKVISRGAANIVSRGPGDNCCG